MRAPLLALPLLLAALLAGCSGSGDGVKHFTIHIGWNDDHESQYMTPATITVKQGDKVSFKVINDDNPGTDYNGPGTSGKDNFHDVALDYPGACDRNPIEHETPAGVSTTTECSNPDGSGVSRTVDYFVADTKGTFSIICEVRTTPSHAALGMRATFIVK